MNQSKKPQKPMMIPSPNGPYIYITDFEPKPVDSLINPTGEKLSKTPSSALCRCGGSQNQPFCDGTHGKIHFCDRKETDGHLDIRKSFEGEKITIHKNPGICAHIGICGRGLPDVFKPKNDKGIDPDAASVDEITDIIKNCPSGSLSYTIDGVEYQPPDRDPLITVLDDGPYHLVGEINLLGHDHYGEGVPTEQCTLCRCGSSKNKPFCDGAHKDIGFKDDKK